MSVNEEPFILVFPYFYFSNLFGLVCLGYSLYFRISAQDILPGITMQSKKKKKLKRFTFHASESDICALEDMAKKGATSSAVILRGLLKVGLGDFYGPVLHGSSEEVATLIRLGSSCA